MTSKTCVARYNFLKIQSISNNAWEMSGSEFVFDTNIFLYLQSGNKDLIEIFNESSIFISVITELELLGYKGMDD